MFLLLMLFALPQDYVTKVQEGTLSHNDLGRVGLIFKHYRYFDETQWLEERDKDGKPVVVFHGIMLDEPATKDYHENNQYAFRRSFKAMHLASYYQLSKDKTKLRYTIYFTFEENGTFSVTAGKLGTLGADSKWVDRDLDNRAVMAILEGIYSNENPYVSLINGMPFKK